jgi:hypothetical protein
MAQTPQQHPEDNEARFGAFVSRDFAKQEASELLHIDFGAMRSDIERWIDAEYRDRLRGRSAT